MTTLRHEAEWLLETSRQRVADIDAGLRVFANGVDITVQERAECVARVELLSHSIEALDHC